MNEQKTEWVEFMKSDTEWRSVKQLGSLLGEAEEIERRIDLASQAYGRFHSLWLRRQRVSEKRRIRLYNALVLPVLLYNCGTWGPTKAMLERLDRFHRRQLRILIGVHYPDRITNMHGVIRKMSLEAAVHYCAQAALTACRAHYATLPTMSPLPCHVMLLLW